MSCPFNDVKSFLSCVTLPLSTNQQPTTEKKHEKMIEWQFMIKLHKEIKEITSQQQQQKRLLVVWELMIKTKKAKKKIHKDLNKFGD